jgi:hypothetical protein
MPSCLACGFLHHPPRPCSSCILILSLLQRRPLSRAMILRRRVRKLQYQLAVLHVRRLKSNRVRYLDLKILDKTQSTDLPPAVLVVNRACESRRVPRITRHDRNRLRTAVKQNIHLVWATKHLPRIATQPQISRRPQPNLRPLPPPMCLCRIRLLPKSVRHDNCCSFCEFCFSKLPSLFGAGPTQTLAAFFRPKRGVAGRPGWFSRVRLSHLMRLLSKKHVSRSKGLLVNPEYRSNCGYGF